MDGINVLSLFDGMSCGQIALERAGIKVKNYYASEIDKYAIKVTMANYPNTIQIRDITKWKDWDIDWSSINLVLAGSPCQGFSFAGKGLNFNDERSKLFFVFVEILNHIKQFNPKILFLLENVQMKYEHELVISRYVGCNPIVINSTLLSAQNRVRNYWTNINLKPVGLFEDMEADIPQPKDKGILLKDILEKEVDKKYNLSELAIAKILRRNWSDAQVEPDKTGTILPKNNSGQLSVDSGTTLINVEGKLKKNQDKASCFTAGGHSGGYHSDMDIIVQCVAIRGREDTSCLTPKRTLYGKEIRKQYESGTIKEQRKNIQQLEPRLDNKTNTLTSVQKDNLIIHNMLPRSSTSGKGGTGHLTKTDDKSYCLDTNQNTNGIEILDKSPCLHGFEHGTNGQFNKQLGNGGMIRRLTEVECERLQTVPDNYTNHVSSTQRYKMLGNGWTVDIISHIFSFMKF